MRERQELVRRDTFTIAGDLHIPASVNLCLNREGTPGVQILKTFLTHPHWTHSPAEPGPKVPVLNMRCEPIIKKGEEKKMDINTRKVKLVKYGKGLRFTSQFLPTLTHGISLGGVR
ncbi:MAG: hypothetical protein ACYCSA_01430 [Thermoplasmataceae archaeon]